jgi:TPR repeat protein
MSDKPGKTFSMRRKKHTIGRLATLASLLFSLDCAAARDLGKGVEAWNKGRYEQAYPIFRHHADHGDTLAKMYLCRFYQQGDEKLRDDDEAFHWCRQAAVDGLDEAQFELGVMYLEGVGIEQDDEQALEWIFRATMQGHKQAGRLMDEVMQGGFDIGC